MDFNFFKSYMQKKYTNNFDFYKELTNNFDKTDTLQLNQKLIHMSDHLDSCLQFSPF